MISSNRNELLWGCNRLIHDHNESLRDQVHQLWPVRRDCAQGWAILSSVSHSFTKLVDMCRQLTVLPPKIERLCGATASSA
jgi:hypothetical protein